MSIRRDSQRVGIGTTSPSAPFVVSNGGAAGMEFHPELTTDTNRLTNYDRTASAYMNFKLDALTQQFNISGSEKMRLTSTGLGIGDTSPLTKLEVAGSIKATNRDTGHTGEAGVTLSYNTSSNIALLETWQSKPLVIDTFYYQQFNIGNTLAMFIDGSNRNVGINTNSPSEKV